jgi:hypothetical protein
MEKILQQGGASKPAKDLITRFVADSVRQRSGFVPGTPDDWPSQGFPIYSAAESPRDDNRNGMPDAWERSRGLDLTTSRATGRDLDPRYDNLEVYLNSL